MIYLKMLNKASMQTLRDWARKKTMTRELHQNQFGLAVPSRKRTETKKAKPQEAQFITASTNRIRYSANFRLNVCHNRKLLHKFKQVPIGPTITLDSKIPFRWSITLTSSSNLAVTLSVMMLKNIKSSLLTIFSRFLL